MFGVDLTDEQKAILDTCPPPDYRTRWGKGQLARITAAAGTGKTTTLLALAIKGAERGHKKITYVTFTIAAAQDGKRRLEQALAEAGLSGVEIDARTLHSAAHRVLKNALSEKVDVNDKPSSLWTEKYIKSWIARECSDAIDGFCLQCFAKIDRLLGQSIRQKQDAKKRARDQVEFFIYKTFHQFCQKAMSRADLAKVGNWERNYYPTKKFHEAGGLNFERAVYSTPNRLRFYADEACRLWDIAIEKNIRSFDIEMKRAQLMGLQIPGSLLLVDESQDMDGCQVDWTGRRQVHFGTHVYVVGDAAQAIYGFRGAKSACLMNLTVDKDCMLTASWRFGEAIARTANCVLFSKHKSPQTVKDWQGRYKNWQPYRVTVGTPKPCQVSTEALLPQWRKSGQFTLIGFANVTLMIEILGLFGPLHGNESSVTDSQSSISAREDSTDDSDDDENFPEQQSVESDDGPTEAGETTHQNFPDEFPKIHVNGGSGSGITAWKITMGQVQDLYKLYLSDPTAPMELPRKAFPEFRGLLVTWCSFYNDCVNRELNKYLGAYRFVATFKKQTVQALERFRAQVLERRFPADKADIILTTCHSAKGMEWDKVQLCEDLTKICCYQRSSATGNWEFAFKGWGDEVNVLYVACTRSKQLLSLPASSIVDVWKDFDSLHQWQVSGSDSTFDLVVSGVNGRLSTEDARGLYKDLVKPLRSEYRLNADEWLVDTLGGEASSEEEEDGSGSATLAVAPTDPVASVVTPEKKGSEEEGDSDAVALAMAPTNPVARLLTYEKQGGEEEGGSGAVALAPPPDPVARLGAAEKEGDGEDDIGSATLVVTDPVAGLVTPKKKRKRDDSI